MKYEVWETELGEFKVRVKTGRFFWRMLPEWWLNPIEAQEYAARYLADYRRGLAVERQRRAFKPRCVGFGRG